MATYTHYTIRHKVSKTEKKVTVDEYQELTARSQNWQIIDRHTESKTAVEKPVAMKVELKSEVKA